MPLYEYVCEADGSLIELLRPARDADEPVADPERKGRAFRRRVSTFAPGGAGSAGETAQSLPQSMCPCGKRRGGCGS